MQLTLKKKKEEEHLNTFNVSLFLLFGEINIIYDHQLFLGGNYWPANYD